MSSNDSLGGMAAAQRGSGNIQRIAPGPALVPVVQSPGPFDLNLSAPFQVNSNLLAIYDMLSATSIENPS